jgi:hypothetical protein
VPLTGSCDVAPLFVRVSATWSGREGGFSQDRAQQACELIRHGVGTAAPPSAAVEFDGVVRLVDAPSRHLRAGEEDQLVGGGAHGRTARPQRRWRQREDGVIELLGGRRGDQCGLWRRQRLTIIGKSLSTLAMGALLTTSLVAPPDPAIWLILRFLDEELREQFRQPSIPSLFVMGTQDTAHDPAYVRDVRDWYVVKGDVLGSVQALAQVTRYGGTSSFVSQPAPAPQATDTTCLPEDAHVSARRCTPLPWIRGR